MNGYQFLVQRNRLLFQFEQDLKRVATLPEEQREAERKRLQARFDVQVAQLYGQVADEFPGERRRRARPLGDPR